MEAYKILEKEEGADEMACKEAGIARDLYLMHAMLCAGDPDALCGLVLGQKLLQEQYGIE